MTHKQHFIYKNLANAASIAGILPLALLFMEDGYSYLIALIIFNNIMDDLDGQLAVKLNIRSQFGANLDNVCDAVAHVVLLLAVAAHYGGFVLIVGLVAATSITLRATSRVSPDAPAGGSPTNELMRHMLFILLLAQIFSINPEIYLVIIFILHSITMLLPVKLPVSIRGLANTTTSIIFVNIALVAAWLLPFITPYIAAAFILTYLYSFIVGGQRWIKEQ